MGTQEDALELAERIVRVQGNRFIRELLREKKRTDDSIRIGVRKDEVLSNLRGAIECGAISVDDLSEWLARVEGWGKQHVYMFRVAAHAGEAQWLSSLEAFSERLTQVGLVSRPDDDLLFPDDLSLEPPKLLDGMFEMSWKRGRHDWARDSAMDREDEIDGDLYQFRAWRHEPRRTLQRFIIAPEHETAVLLNPIPLGGDHEDAKVMALEAAARVIPRQDMTMVSVSNAIRALDQADLEGAAGTLPEDQGQFHARDTRFRAHGASVAFSSDPDVVSYTVVEPVRRVRRALRTEEFSGESAKLVIQLDSGAGMKRSVTMSLDGRNDRLYLFAQMTRGEVWSVLAKIYEVLG